MKQVLVERLYELSNEVINILCSGKGTAGDNKEIIEFPAGTLQKVNDLLSRRNEIIDLLKDKNKEPENKETSIS